VAGAHILSKLHASFISTTLICPSAAFSLCSLPTAPLSAPTLFNSSVLEHHLISIFSGRIVSIKTILHFW
jgi:hypothetical protein